ncbi:MAG: FMN-binding glutamate synthase family protein [Proteobacteria bacterium]|nr:FMN-binding glutamate synthase family protein [Pseudomonadota bacterium]
MLRYSVFYIIAVLAVAFAHLARESGHNYYWAFSILGPLALLGIWDLVQTRHSVLRNYPIIGHLRWLFEEIRPELRQYFFTGDKEEEPFNRDQRSLVYQRAKDVEDNTPFGTKLDVYEENYAWLNHSMAPKPISEAACRTLVGGPDCKQPYSASVLNISALSFGALSGNAIAALNKGAKLGNFAHDTGEGSISRYHRSGGGDLIWEIGTGYFGCRKEDGSFCADTFAARASEEQVRMIEIKLSQGAKPGHGGILPGAKVTPEIAEARDVPQGQDVISPPAHSAFSTPIQMMEFIAVLREKSGGKPVGFKLCVGHRWEFMALCKAMIETGIAPDFIVVDGSEGGTGAAPLEFTDHIGTPLVDGLAFVQNALVGSGLRGKISVAASGKVISAFDMVKLMSLGADWVNAARAFMFAVGCIQSQACHTNRCPTGVATQDKRRQAALDVDDKAKRVFNYHRNTIHALTEVLSSAGLASPEDLRREHFWVRDGDSIAHPAEERGQWIAQGSLLDGSAFDRIMRYWNMAQADTFAPKN